MRSPGSYSGSANANVRSPAARPADWARPPEQNRAQSNFCRKPTSPSASATVVRKRTEAWVQVIQPPGDGRVPCRSESSGLVLGLWN